MTIYTIIIREKPSKAFHPHDRCREIILDWYQLSLEAERYTEGYRGPVAARMYAYLGIGGYALSQPFFKDSLKPVQILFPQLNLPRPNEIDSIEADLALNACYSELMRKFFVTANNQIHRKFQQLERKWHNCENTHSRSCISKDYGIRIANAVFDWAATDSVGHQAYLFNYDRDFVFPDQPGSWKPCPEFPMPPLLPNWGKSRCFFICPDDFLAKPLPPYSASVGSFYHKAAMEVYTVTSPLSEENKWIAEFWSDDQPGLTFSPAGRWISIVCQILEQETPSYEKSIETFLKVGVALSDAFTACWNSKYHYQLERPQTFIMQEIDPSWLPLHHTPPFPAYPSGHAMIGSTIAEILTNLFGKDYSMWDRSHEGRTEFLGNPRKFTSFQDMANESAFSRIPLGVHFRFDCEEGIRLGRQIGQEVNSISIHTASVAAKASF